MSKEPENFGIPTEQQSSAESMSGSDATSSPAVTATDAVAAAAAATSATAATSPTAAQLTANLWVTGGALAGAAARPFKHSIEGSTLSDDERSLHEHFMLLAIEAAQQAESLGEVPVGAVLVAPNGEIVATGYNRTITDHDASAHAEIVAMRLAGQKLQNYRLPELTLYVTLEPCCMCIMAAIHARIAKVVYGTSDPRTGACGSVFNISGDPRHNHSLEVIAHIKQEECAQQLRQFFKQRRAAQKQAKQQAKAQAALLSAESNAQS